MRAPVSQGGFTLIELMVGSVLGLLAILIVTQVLAISQGQSRTTGAGNDAQLNGALALFALQRDIEQAGYGAAAMPNALGCPVKAQPEGSPAFSLVLAPVLIQSGGSDGSDSITILRAGTAQASVPMPLTESHGRDDTSFSVASSLGVRETDILVAIPPELAWEKEPDDWWCVLASASADADNPLGPTTVPTVAGGWNQPALMPPEPFRGSAITSDPRSYLLNLGAMVLHTYSVSGQGNLQISERSPHDGSIGAPQELYSQIVKLKALYGKDTDGDGIVDFYDAQTPTTNAGWRQVLALRIAMVSRSAQYEKELVTDSAPLWNIGTTTVDKDLDTQACHGNSQCIALDLSELKNWEHYRYRLYDTVVPLRNVLWNS